MMVYQQRLAMKHLLALIILCMPIAVFAMSCPNSSAIIDQGDSVQEVLQRCGEPVSKNEYTKKISIARRLEYFIPNAGQASSKVAFLMSNDRVTNIILYNNGQSCQSNVDEDSHVVNTNCSPSQVNLTSTNVCGSLVSVNSSTANIIAACGAPALQQDLQFRDVRITELLYSGSRESSNKLQFEDDKLLSGN
jgi:hypothetical protein